jgi:hypothetical protein
MPQRRMSATGFTVTEWRSLCTGTSLRGFFTLELPSGLVIVDCSLHEKGNGEKWVGMPARSYTKDNGSVAWVQVVGFTDKATRQRFSKQALAALDECFEREGR